MMMTGAGILVECLIEQGIDTVFGYPGGSVLHIYDELYRNEDRIRHVLTAHEQGAAHAADGYARASGKPGVVLATSGPGATNLVTGIATAYMDSVPLVAITGNVPVPLLGRDSFQEVDIAGVTMPVTKHNFIVKDVARLAETMRAAFSIAMSGRPGPVLVDIPKDVTADRAEWTALPLGERARLRAMPSPSDADVEAALAMVRSAKRPLLMAGGGVIASGASAELSMLAERLDAPVALTLMGHGALPASHPLFTGMIGMHGTKASNLAVRSADLIVAMGTRFSDRVVSDRPSFTRSARILHIDVDAAEISKNVRCHGSLVGDVKEVLSRMLARLEPSRKPEWLAQVEAWKGETPARADSGGRLDPFMVLDAIHERVGDEAVITTEVGQHQIWTAQRYPFAKPRTFISSGGLGTMGFGTGAAMGAQMARPDAQVVHVAGDGSFRMNCAELATIAHYGLPILIVIMNNGTLGMVRQWQTMFYGKRYAETTLDRPPDFVKLADAYGIRAWRPRDAAELRTAIDEAVSSRRPGLIDCVIDIDECVLPIVPPGRPIEEQIMATKD
ncbi:MAG: acetolactate synthase, large subunit, biosynthetic type [Spirochaetae bacterium HGW-Spirochaetae-3]|jgi:acetolactate synthase-1/2/3 large subunit|nr:MAG: acetolactate synthase, large subunit, biosynthetic type [Spirochaetae bacterium HGW-Spirochaetae-3]